MLSKEKRKEKLLQLESFPSRLNTLIESLNKDQLVYEIKTGGWSIKQIIHHLADAQLNAYIRMKLILTEDHPTLKTYDQDKWVELSDTTECPVEHSLLLLENMYKRWIILLNNVEDKNWSRTAHHPENGDITLEGLLMAYTSHGENHLQQIKLRFNK